MTCTGDDAKQVDHKEIRFMGTASRPLAIVTGASSGAALANEVANIGFEQHAKVAKPGSSVKA